MTLRDMKLTATCIALCAGLAVTLTGQEKQDVFRFKTGVELINVTATVTDSNGRFVSEPAQGGLPAVRGRPGAADHAFQQRTCSRQPGPRCRHERQHGGRTLVVGTAGPEQISLPAARARRRSLSLPVRQSAGARRGMDDRSRADRDRPRAHPAEGRDIALRCRRGGVAARAVRAPSQEGDRRPVRWQRYEQPHDRARDQVDDPIDGSDGVRHRHRQL